MPIVMFDFYLLLPISIDSSATRRRMKGREGVTESKSGDMKVSESRDMGGSDDEVIDEVILLLLLPLSTHIIYSSSLQFTADLLRQVVITN